MKRSMVHVRCFPAGAQQLIDQLHSFVMRQTLMGF
jgi:hypothetical protein